MSTHGTRWKRKLTAPLAIALMMVASCTTSEPTRFYTLASVTEQGTPVTAPQPTRRTIGVGPVSLPRYLDRPQIVSRDGPYRIRLAEFDSWGEPLEDLVPRVLSRNLAVLLNTEDVLALPRRRQGGVDTRVEVEILRFDFEPGEAAVLIARWEVFRGDDDIPSRSDIVTIREPISDVADGDGLNYEAAVAAMSETLADLSRQIAAAIPQARTKGGARR